MTKRFQLRVEKALNDEHLGKALGHARDGFVVKRQNAIDAFPEFEQYRERAAKIRAHTLAHLDDYLLQYVEKVEALGGQVHWAPTAADARQIILDICAAEKAKVVTKGKSMVSEEVGLNPALEEAGYELVETDLGEYIIQLAHEPPSHIIAPAVHKTREQITELFHQHHQALGYTEKVTSIPGLVNEARQVLRQQFLSADVGITGANFLIAETGAGVIVTNEGNGDLTMSLPRVHIAITGIEKVVPTLDDVGVLLRVLGRSATGQSMTSYTTFFAGPRRDEDADGPEAFHVVLVDNGRSRMLADPEFHDMLRCIRCGACLNHCPVYGSIGGHAYGWVYPGPMGSILTARYQGLDHEPDLPNACTLNGHCAEVCPVKIPLSELMRGLRRHQHAQGMQATPARWGLGLWAALAQRPRLYRMISRMAAGTMARAGKQGVLRRWPLAGGWFAGGRDLPKPQGQTFMDAWRKRNG